MPTEIKMPQLGESVVEGTITKWLKQEGDSIDEDELLVEVSTDKVDSEVPSSASGTIQEIKVQEGETVKVGEVIAVIGEGGSSSGDESGADEGEADEPEGEGGDAATSADDQPETEGKEKEESGEDQAAESDDDQPQADAASQDEDGGEDEQASQDDGGEQKDQDGDGDQAARSDDGAQGKEKGSGGSKAASRSNGAGGDGSDTSKRGIISPLVRRLADEHGVDLEDIEGSGTGGRIRKQDVLKFVETGKGQTQAKPAASAEPAPDAETKPAPSKKGKKAASGDREELVPWINIRRRTAEHMVASARETARAWNAVEVDWTNVVKLRERTKDAFKEREGFNLTYMGFLGRALCEALLEMPEVNATYDEENQANRIKHYVNLGIAVALEGGGLIVPVIKNADELNLVGLSRQINEVAQKARSKKLSPDDLTGGTFTITNPGPFGSVISVPIIPRGQAAILGFETIRKGVVVTDDDTIAIRSIGILDLSWDHRVIDGAEAARFLSALKERIETMDFSGDLSQYL